MLRETLAETRSSDEGETQTTTRRIETEPGVRTGFERWLQDWRAWAATELENEPVREIYRWLFQMSEQAGAAPEELELVAAIGCLSWIPEHHDEVRRHVLTVPVQIDFDDQLGRLTVRTSEQADGFTLELDMLDAAFWPRAERLNELRERAQSADHHLLARDEAQILLQPLVNNIDPDGRYEDGDEPSESASDAALAFAPAIVLRRRSNQGLLRIFQEMKRQLEQSSDVPEGIRQLVDVVETRHDSEGDSSGLVADGNTYLPLPANQQQLEIVRRVDTRRHSVVQGPPGTGKTHTIANLLAHLLAKGQRVLVTAHTDRALRELRDKLPESLESLCVSIVGRERSDLADLKVAVDTLASRAAEYDAARAAVGINELETKLDELRREVSRLHSSMLEARERETRIREFGTYRGTLAEIASQHRGEADENAWLLDFDAVVSEDAPLNDQEAMEWLALLRDPGLARDEPEAAQSLIELGTIPVPSKFAELIDAELAASTRADAHSAARSHAAYEAIARLDLGAREELRRRFQSLSKEATELAARNEPWMSSAMRDVHSQKAELWQHRYAEIAHQLPQCREVIDRLDPTAKVEVTDAQPAALVPAARELKEHLERGGKLKGVITPRPVKRAAQLLANVRVNDNPPTTAEALTTFIDWMDARRQLDYIEQLWPADLHIPGEDTLVERWGWNQAEVNQLSRVIRLAEALRAEEAKLEELGISKPDWADLQKVRAFGAVVEAVTASEESEEARHPLVKIADSLSEACWKPDAAATLVRLKDAVKSRDAVAYRESHARLERLAKVRALAARKDELGRQLARVAPRFVEAVADSPADNRWNRLSRFQAAWQWCWARVWIHTEAAADVDDLQRQMHAAEDRIRHTVTELTAAKAWSLAVSRLGLREQQNLKGYVLAVKKLGKGTGKYAPHRRAEARAELRECRSAVPVWVMPIYRIAEALQIDRNMFDVVVIDEASQAGVEAAFLQYLAPRIVVVGDDRQVSPSGVGLDNQQLIDLRRQLLFDFDHGHVWENPTASFFDLARIRYGDVITLREHFRCVPEIIGFSNRIAYEPDRVPLIPLRQYGVERLDPIQTVYVDDGYVVGSSGKVINPPEGERIVETILKCCADPAYDGKTFGVISLTGRAQAQRIEHLLLEQMDPKEFRTRQLRCGDSADFQGSERDVVFLSMVAVREEGKPYAPLVREGFVQRFNVAGSRARDQMWVFHSVRVEELTNHEDMRYQLLDYCHGVQRHQRLDTDTGLGSVPRDIQVDPFESMFEQHIYNSIYERGFTVIPQWEVYGYRIDLVVVGGHSRLAVECDGDRWHGPDRYEQDLGRQRELERCGWTFFRVRASSFYSDSHAALERLWELLEARNIRPNSWSPSEVEEGSDDRKLTSAAGSEPEAMKLPQPPPPRIQTVEDPGEIASDSRDAPVEEDSWLYEIEGPAGKAVVGQIPEAPATREGVEEMPTSDEGAGRRGEPPSSAGSELGARRWNGLDDAESRVEASEPAIPGEPGLTPSSPGRLLAPYVSWQQRSVRAVLDSTPEKVAGELVEIVSVEGPMQALRLYQVHAKGAGNQRVGRDMREAYNRIVLRAVRGGRLVQVRDDVVGQVNKTLYVIGGSPVVVRELGPRQLHELPRSEISELITLLGVDRSQPWVAKRAVLDALGLVRLTQKTSGYLDECLRYLWTH